MTQFSDYERAVDTLLFLSDQFTLDFVVTFATKDQNGQRRFFHTETEYDTTKYNSGVSSTYRSVKRKMTNFYFHINNRKAFDGGFVIRTNDVYLLIHHIEELILPLYFDPDKRVFETKDKQLFITGQYTPLDYIQSPTSYIRIIPAICRYDDGQFKEGVRFYINSDSNFVDMDIDRFLSFYYILKTTDMYSAAAHLATYTKVQPYDVNVWKPGGGLGSFSKNDDSSWMDQQNGVDSEEKKANNFLQGLGTKKKR